MVLGYLTIAAQSMAIRCVLDGMGTEICRSDCTIFLRNISLSSVPSAKNFCIFLSFQMSVEPPKSIFLHIGGKAMGLIVKFV